MPSVTLQEASTSSLPMSAQIILFGPQGTEITHALRNVLTRAGIAHHGHDERSNTSIPGHAQQQARNFLLEALTALQIESKHIQRTGLILPHNEGNNYFPTPDVFSSWQRLVEWHAADGYLDPATAGALLCTVQIASLILSGCKYDYEGEPEPPRRQAGLTLHHVGGFTSRHSGRNRFFEYFCAFQRHHSRGLLHWRASRPRSSSIRNRSFPTLFLTCTSFDRFPHSRPRDRQTCFLDRFPCSSLDQQPRIFSKRSMWWRP